MGHIWARRVRAVVTDWRGIWLHSLKKMVAYSDAVTGRKSAALAKASVIISRQDRNCATSATGRTAWLRRISRPSSLSRRGARPHRRSRSSTGLASPWSSTKLERRIFTRRGSRDKNIIFLGVAVHELRIETASQDFVPHQSRARRACWKARLALPFDFALCDRAHDPKPRCADPSILGRDRDSTLPDRLDEGAVVAKVLVGVFDRELAYRVVEGRIGAQVARNHCGIAGSRMRPCERPGAELAEFPQHRDVPVFHDGRDFRVAKLAEVIIAAVLSARPAEENVACRLHEALARHDPLALVLVQGLAGVRLEH